MPESKLKLEKMFEPKLELSVEYGLEELVEVIRRQWNEDEIFELIKELDDDVANFDFTEKLHEHFDELYHIDQTILVEEKEKDNEES